MTDLPDTTGLSLAGEFPPADEESWRALVDQALKGAAFDSLLARTEDGITLKPLYTLRDEPEEPGPRAFPATRPWDVQQLTAEPDAAAANAAVLEDLAGGASSVALRVAAPEQTGLALHSHDDLARALHGVHLHMAGVHLEPGIGWQRAAEALEAAWDAHGTSEDDRRGGFGADPLGALAHAGGLTWSLEQALSSAAGLVRRAAAWPKVTALTADARVYHDAGATEAQELACLCATLAAYLRACEDAGITPGDALAKIELKLAANADLFATIAKLRAARLLAGRIAEACGVKDATRPPPLSATTSQRMMARRDPYVNMVRATVACAGAALGGADAVTVLPFTWALGRPDAFARRIARNVQIVLQQEASLGRVGDPAGGSWYVDTLTHEMAQAAWALFQRIEAEGGMARALAAGWVQRAIREAAEARAGRVAAAEEKVIGVNAFPHLSKIVPEAEPWPLPDELDDPAVTVEPLPLRRSAAPFEALRDAADAQAAKTGTPPQALLVLTGADPAHNERATFAARLFAAGGIESIRAEPIEDPQAAAKAFARSGAALACLCGVAETEGERLGAMAKALKAAGAGRVYLADRPGEQRSDLRATGVDAALHEGCDMLEVLRDAHSAAGTGKGRKR